MIDDQETDRRRLRELLAAAGRFVVFEASNGREGLRKAHEIQPKVIFLDLMMPDMTGAEVLERLRDDPATKEIPVIINTSKNLNDGERLTLGRGAVGILDKTSDYREGAFGKLSEALVRAGLSLVEAHDGSES